MNTKKFTLGILATWIIIVVFNFITNRIILSDAWKSLESSGFFRDDASLLVISASTLAILLAASYIIGLFNQKLVNENPVLTGSLFGAVYGMLYVGLYFVFEIPLSFSVISMANSIISFAIGSLVFSKIYKEDA